MQVHDALNSLIVADDHDRCDLPALEDQQRAAAIARGLKLPAYDR